jgi:hypothetical protein
MEHNPIQNDARRARRLRHLGHNNVCIFCGEFDPDALLRVRRSVLEEDHVVGRANDRDLTIVICRNCHAKKHARMRAAGVQLEQTPHRTVIDLLIAILGSLGVFFGVLAEALCEWADRLTALGRALDAKCPCWRALPETSRW